MAIRELPFAELLSDVVDNRGRTCPVDGEGYLPLIATNCISNDRLYPSYETTRWVSKDIYETWFRGHPQAGDLIFVCKGSPGRVCMVPDPVDFCIAQDMVAIRADSGKVYPRYLLAALRSPTVQARIANMHVGTMIPHFKKGDFDKLLIPVLDEPDQKGIGDLYFALSAKIECNRRTAQGLERLARAIFRAWFVDFEPVKAKAGGATSYPSMPQAVFNALPTCFIESKIGPVPDGWDVGALEDVLSARKERINPSEESLRLPYVPIECITAKRVTLEESKDGSEAQSSLVRFVAGDILFGAMRPYFHKVCLAPFDGTTRTTCFVLSPRRDKDRAFSLMLASEASTVEYATNHSVGSTIPYAKWENSLAEMPCIIPSVTCREAFADLIDSPLQLCQQLVRESHELTRMRDYLLPRLLSGDVRVDVQTMGLPG